MRKAPACAQPLTPPEQHERGARHREEPDEAEDGKMGENAEAADRRRQSDPGEHHADRDEKNRYGGCGRHR
jgi:hypothetical protein